MASSTSSNALSADGSSTSSVLATVERLVRDTATATLRLPHDASEAKVRTQAGELVRALVSSVLDCSRLALTSSASAQLQ